MKNIFFAIFLLTIVSSCQKGVTPTPAPITSTTGPTGSFSPKPSIWYNMTINGHYFSYYGRYDDHNILKLTMVSSTAGYVTVTNNDLNVRFYFSVNGDPFFTVATGRLDVRPTKTNIATPYATDYNNYILLDDPASSVTLHGENIIYEDPDTYYVYPVYAGTITGTAIAIDSRQVSFSLNFNCSPN